MKILLTGYTGNLGPAIAQALVSHQVHALVRYPHAASLLPHVTLHEGDLEHLPQGLKDEVEIIIHSAANTSFRLSLEELRKSNVDGTAQMISYARQCPHLKKFVQVSTACVCGDSEGEIPEAPLPRPEHFVNHYEESKWGAEELIFQSGLPAEVVRLSIVAGSEMDGAARRMGALHHTLFWLWKGLIPMMPGTPQSRVDMISTEYAAAVIATCVEAPLKINRVIHGCAGEYTAPTLSELLDHLTEIFSTHSPAWKSGGLMAPAIVDAETFTLFEQSVQQSRDALFLRVCEDANSFLPGLLHPRRHLTHHADALCQRPRANWRSLAQLVTNHVITTRS